jgi:hypothetical protein
VQQDNGCADGLRHFHNICERKAEDNKSRGIDISAISLPQQQQKKNENVEKPKKMLRLCSKQEVELNLDYWTRSLVEFGSTFESLSQMHLSHRGRQFVCKLGSLRMRVMSFLRSNG